MFTPEYLNELVESTSAAATDFNMYLTNKVIDSIISLFERDGKLEIIPSNQHRIRLLKQSGILVSDIEQEIKKRLPGLDKKIRDAFYQAGYDINEEINKSVSDLVESNRELKSFVGKAPRLENLTGEERQILDAAYKRTNGEIKNLTRTTAADINQQFLKSCDSAWWKATHGVDTATAIREAIDEVSAYGSHVIYRNKGKERKFSIESAIRMCVLTGINQANAEITLSLCAEMGTKNVLVSSHLGARYTDKVEPANHESWQGKIYTLSDPLLEKFGYKEHKNKSVFAKIKEFFQKFRKKKIYEDFETVTGYGSIEGLCGINCRHTFEPFYPGMTNNQRQYDSEENKKAYDLSQKKRAMERKIRETKKQLFEKRHAIKTANDETLITSLKIEEAEIKALFDKQNSAYSAFCGQNGLRRSEDRLYVSNVSRQNAVEQSGEVSYNIPRSRDELQKSAQEIRADIGNYANNPSKWSGNIAIDNSLASKDILGQKEWNCDITLIDTADNGTIWHEMLHSCSASYYNGDTYAQNKWIEETSVEFLKHQICKEQKIISIPSYENRVDILRSLNQKFKYGTDIEFAKELYNIPLPERYQWLEDRVDMSLRSAGVSFEDYNEVMKYIQNLKGGKP